MEAAGKYTGLTDAITPGSSSSSTGSVRSWVYEYGGVLDTLLTFNWVQLLLDVLLRLCALQVVHRGVLSKPHLAATASAAADLVLAAMQYACSAADPSDSSISLNQPGPRAEPEAWQFLVCSVADVCKVLTEPMSAYATCSPAALQSSSCTSCKMLMLLLGFSVCDSGARQSRRCSQGAAGEPRAASGLDADRTASCAGSSSSSSSSGIAAGSAPAQESGGGASGSHSSRPLSLQPVRAAEPGALSDAAAASLLQARQEAPDTFPVAYLRMCELLACDPKALWAIGSYAHHAAPVICTALMSLCRTGLAPLSTPQLPLRLLKLDGRILAPCLSCSCCGRCSCMHGRPHY